MRPLAVNENRWVRCGADVEGAWLCVAVQKNDAGALHLRVSPGCCCEREYQSLSSCLGAPTAARVLVATLSRERG